MKNACLMNNIHLSFDFGTKSIGVAIGQYITRTARPLHAIKAHNGIPNWNVIRNLIKEWKPKEVIVGLPLNMDNTEQLLTIYARKFAKKIHGRFGITVKLHDERLSTVEAHDRLFKYHGFHILNKSIVDSTSAVIILESYFHQSF